MTTPIAPPATVFVTGATGFVGTHVRDLLLQRGYRVRALVRRTGSLPAADGLEEAPGDITNPASLAPALQNCHAVIHLVGIIEEKPSRGITFDRIHHQGAVNVINAARDAGIARYVHMSALGTRPNAAARYHQTKWTAEEHLRQSGLAYTIFRPSLIHGPDGEFTQMLRNWATGKAAPFLFMPFFGSGLLGQTNTNPISPVHVDDVAALFVDALTTPASIGKTYDVGGPERLSWRELLRTASAAFRGKPKMALGIPAWYAKLLASLPLPLPFNRDQVLMSQEPNAADPAPIQADFPHWRPQPFTTSLPQYARQVR